VLVRHSPARVIEAIKIRHVDEFAHAKIRHHSIETVAPVKVLGGAVRASGVNRAVLAYFRDKLRPVESLFEGNFSSCFCQVNPIEQNQFSPSNSIHAILPVGVFVNLQ
jgi:hypothetical protein